MLRTPSTSTFNQAPENSDSAVPEHQAASCEPVPHNLGLFAIADEVDIDWKPPQMPPDRTIKSRDFEKGNWTTGSKAPYSSPNQKARERDNSGQPWAAFSEKEIEEARRLDVSNCNTDRTANVIAQDNPKVTIAAEESPRRPFGKRGISNVLPAMPAMPRVLSTTVFSATNPTGLPTVRPTTAANITSPLHRSTSLPSRLNRLEGAGSTRTEAQTVPYVRHVTAMHPTFDAKGSDIPKKHLSRTSAVLLLLASTGLVAVCAEFLVASINYLVDNTGVSEAFIGLIVLPIIGNAAEHVTAVTVAGKNKMDLAIGVAVGSSIQIALFVTPVVVLLGWALQKDMSLYFSLFETISLFVSAFIVSSS